MNRCILRFSGTGMSPAEVTEHLQSMADVVVLDSSAKMFLIEGNQPDLELAVQSMAGWQLTPERFTPLPNPRKKIDPRA
jgi:hypothetical protein